MKRSEVVNFMMESLKDYYQTNASESGARIDEGLSFILSRLEQANLINENWDLEEDNNV